MKKFLLFIVMVLLVAPTMGHNLRGNIKDKSGLPIPFATVFFKEGAQGTTTNENGDFEITLPPGKYSITYRSLGYKPRIETIILTSKPQEVAVVLEEQFQELEEVTISAGVDRAYPIMRKVISLQFVHLNQMLSYSASAYLRGTLKVENIPGIFRNQLKKQNIDIKSGDILVQESVNEITFKAPDKYDLKIKSINSSFPKGIDFQVTDILGSSLYQDNIDMLISPVGKSAFGHYDFKYEGFSYEGKNIVNKIKVTPKRRSKLLFEGYLYIMEEFWCLRQADLNFETPVGTVNMYMIYDEVSPYIWLPVSHKFSFEASLMGFKGNGKFSTSMKYTDLQFNQGVLAMLNLPAREIPENQNPKPGTTAKVKTIKPPRSLEKKREKIDVLLEKKDLSNREMNKLSRLMESAQNQTKPDTLKSLEITESVKVKIDPNAAKRDSLFWSTMRPIPLGREELQSFQKRDSIVREEQKKPKGISFKQKNMNRGLVASLLLGHSSTMRDSSWHFNYFGMFNFNRISFNAVDGFTISQEFLFTKKFLPGKSLEIRPQASYAFSRNALMGNLGIKYNYSPLHRGTIELRGGLQTQDFNTREQAISPFFNGISSLLFKTNYARYFENRYVKVGNKVDLANGLVLMAKMEYKNTRQLENSSNFSFFSNKVDYKPNLPENAEVTDANLTGQISTTAGFRLEYTPKYFYKIRNGVKVMSYSSFPTIFFGYDKGVKNILGSTSDFDYLTAGIGYFTEFSQTSSLAMEFNAGYYSNSKQIHFSDFAHVMTQTIPVLPHEYRHSFYLPDYYTLSTSDRYIQGFISYKAPFILLKFLPVLSNTLWREMIWAGYYSSPVNQYHTEVGYTLLEVFYSTNVGIFAGFDKLTFSRVGINLAFRIAY